MAELIDIVSFCDELLDIKNIEDYQSAYNGLQVSSTGKVKKIASAVDCNLLTIERSVEEHVDCLFVHHGMFWGNNLPITDVNYNKYKLLIDNNIAVYSAHLPLDMNVDFGNNASIVKELNLKVSNYIVGDHNFKMPIAKCDLSREDLKSKLLKLFPCTKSLDFGTKQPMNVAICSGGGGGLVSKIFDGSFDTIITGEVQQHHFGFAYDNKLNLYVCGHYDTETFGVKNLAKIVSDKFHLENVWIEENCCL